MAVEKVDIVQMHALETLVERCHQIFARAPIAIRSRPHVVAGLGRDEKLVAIGAEVVVHQSAHSLFGRSIDGTVVVGQVEMSDTVVESIVGYLTTTFVGVNTTKVVPETKANLRQQHT